MSKRNNSTLMTSQASRALITAAIMALVLWLVVPTWGRQPSTEVLVPAPAATPSPAPTPSVTTPSLPWYYDVTKLKDFVTALGILIGGLFAYFKFFKGRTFKPRLELSVSGKVIHDEGVKLLATALGIKNTGLSVVFINKELTRLEVYLHKPLSGSGKNIEWLRTDPPTRAFSAHGWVEPGETINDHLVVKLPDDDYLIYRIELVVRSRWPSLPDKLKAWKKRRRLGGKWRGNYVVEPKPDADEQGHSISPQATSNQKLTPGG